ncbi:uncharacterized protein BCR38DRAFT_424878 [Pseudomassariella vexata]|uniref:Secreted protein n=1 Tax=Pseudomassariella vexata TaxID=1141098 RepID=A0A1Y2EDV0_9PEZI|nr:uncharacterized protein BCR38DRAFT_424878 [Pseudomassariella vexata]ORY68965.1 hypothetical protein BCR38DRAFT_424878 [Pseudomassariella vexata]
MHVFLHLHSFVALLVCQTVSTLKSVCVLDPAGGSPRSTATANRLWAVAQKALTKSLCHTATVESLPSP